MIRGNIMGFNPYFYGTSTSTQILNWYCNSLIQFQSLFLWNIYFNKTILEETGIDVKVSILIFMEHLLQLIPSLSALMRRNSVSILIFMEHLLQQPVKLYRLKINAYKIFLTELF